MQPSPTPVRNPWETGTAIRRFLMWLMVAAFVLGGLIGASLFLVVTSTEFVSRMTQTLWGMGVHCAASYIVMRSWRTGAPSRPVAAGLVVFGLNFLALLAGIWVLPEEFQGRAWVATAFLMGYSVLMWPAIITLLVRRLWWLGLATIVWDIAACAVSMAAMWTALWDHWKHTEKPLFVGASVSAGLTLTCLLFLIEGAAIFRVARLIVLPFIWAGTGMLIAVTFDHFLSEVEMYMRVLGAVSVIALCSLVALAVAARLTAEKGRTGEIEVSLTCPVCDKPATVRTGDSACSACGSEFYIRIKPTRCVRCGYSLAGLSAKRCPECGLRW